MHKGRDDWDSSSKWIQRQKMWGIFQRKIWGFWTSNARQYINRQIAIFLLLPKVQAFDPCVQKQSTQKWVKIRRVQFPHRTIQISTVVENSQLSRLPRYRWKIWTDPLSDAGSFMQCFMLYRWLLIAIIQKIYVHIYMFIMCLIWYPSVKWDVGKILVVRKLPIMSIVPKQ